MHSIVSVAVSNGQYKNISEWWSTQNVAWLKWEIMVTVSEIIFRMTRNGRSNIFYDYDYEFQRRPHHFVLYLLFVQLIIIQTHGSCLLVVENGEYFQLTESKLEFQIKLRKMNRKHITSARSLREYSQWNWLNFKLIFLFYRYILYIHMNNKHQMTNIAYFEEILQKSITNFCKFMIACGKHCIVINVLRDLAQSDTM